MILDMPSLTKHSEFSLIFHLFNPYEYAPIILTLIFTILGYGLVSLILASYSVATS